MNNSKYVCQAKIFCERSFRI